MIFHWYWRGQELKHREKGLLEDLTTWVPFLAREADLAGGQGTPWGMGWLLQPVSLSPHAGCFCVSWLIPAPLCVYLYIRKKHRWLERSPHKLCSMLRCGGLFVSAMGKQQYQKVQYRSLLLARVALTDLNDEGGASSPALCFLGRF